MLSIHTPETVDINEVTKTNLTCRRYDCSRILQIHRAASSRMCGRGLYSLWPSRNSPETNINSQPEIGLQEVSSASIEDLFTLVII